MSAEKQALSNMEEFNAYFYTLVSLDTDDFKYAENRQQYLVDQGFYFEIIQEMPFMKDEKEKKKLRMSSNTEQNDLLNKIMASKNGGDMILEKEVDELEKDEDMKFLNE